MDFHEHTRHSLVAALEERAKKLYPDLWERCSDSLTRPISVSRRKDGKADGLITFFLAPREPGRDVVVRECRFICHAPNDKDIVWTSVMDHFD